MKDSALKRKLLYVNDRFYIFRRLLVMYIRYWIHVKPMKYRLSIMNIKETIKYIQANECSVARLGDGEFHLLLNKGNISFEKESNEICESLKAVLYNKNVLLCVPSALNSVKGLKEEAIEFWLQWGINYQQEVVELIRLFSGTSYCFGDAFITRPYIIWKNTKKSGEIFIQIKKLWNNREILIVEGNQTRLGVGNDLFDNVLSIKRILVPSKGAFSEIENIKQSVHKYYNGELILLACGPTATILAAYFADRNMRALDIGHIDIEYEWFLQKTDKKVAVKGKYTNEAQNGNVVSECKDEKYISEIIEQIGDPT